MAQISSFNIQPSKGNNTIHNDRTQAPKYLLENNRNFEVNRTAKEAEILRREMQDKADRNYTERTGQKPQYKQDKILWSAVVNLKPDSTMQDLEKLADHFKEKYGWQCYQIAIHRDEGHLNKDGEQVINHHAHLEFLMLDEQGKTAFKRADFTKAKMREIQTETAQILGMERGKDARETKKKHKSHREFKAEKAHEAEKEALIARSAANEIAGDEVQLDKPLTKKEAQSTIKSAFQYCENEQEKEQLKALFYKVKEREKADFNITAKDLEREFNFIFDLERRKREKELKDKIKALESDLSHERTKNDKLPHQEQENATEAKFDPFTAKNSETETLRAENERLRAEKAELIEIFTPTMRKWERDANYIEKFDMLNPDAKKKALDTAIASNSNLKRLERLGAFVYKTADKVSKMIHDIGKKLGLTISR